VEFNLTSKKTFYIFSLIALFLYLLDLACYLEFISNNKYFKDYYDEYLNITYETNIPTFFSFLLSFLTGLTALMIYKAKRGKGWLVVSLFFFYLGFDDALSLHEYIGSYLGDFFLTDNYKSYYWQATFVPIFGAIGLYIVYFLVNEFKNENCIKCIFFLLLGFSFYAIAVGLDYYEGLDPDLRYFMKKTDLFYKELIHILRASEEVIEMLGAVIIWSTLLKIHPLKISVK